jgi:tetratricopeptide (TPR) repeat protein
MKKTLITLIASGLLSAAGLKAQTIQEGMNHLYADRFKSAMSVFEKLLATNPNNLEAIYWMGQTYFDMDDNAAARKLYEKALTTNGGAPLILIGLGHSDLLENKTSDARQKFEAAITAATTKKGVEQAVLNAIGRANVDAKAGDFMYAIKLLEQAADKGEKNPETYLQLGNAYRKARPGEGGGMAYQTYKKALEVNPSFAVASLRLAKLFESQKNWELVIEYLNDATKRDPKFAPAYYELFYYNFFRQKYPEAEEQLKKFVDNSDNDPAQNEFLFAQLCWAKKDYICAISKAEMVVTVTGEKTKPKVLKLLADSYFQQGDYNNAKKYINWYLQREKTEDKISYDYKLKADILAKAGGTPDEILATYLQGAVLDSVLTSKIDFLKQGAEFFKAQGDSTGRSKEGELRLEIVKLKSPNVGQRDLFDAGFAFYQAKNYPKADSIFDIYTDKFPTEVFGPMMQYNIHRAMDSTMEKGLAVPWAEKYLNILEADTAKNKKNIIGVAGYLASYYANIVKDRTKALDYLRKMLVLDPANEAIKNNISILEKAPATKPSSPSKGTQPPAKASTPKPAAKATAKTTTVVKKT